MFAIDGVNGLVQEQRYKLVEIEGGGLVGTGKGGVAIGIDQECHQRNEKRAKGEQVGRKPIWDVLHLMDRWNIPESWTDGMESMDSMVQGIGRMA